MMTTPTSTRTVALIVEQPLGPPAAYGLARLAAALEDRGWRCTRVVDPEVVATDAGAMFVVSAAPHGRTVQWLAARAGTALPETAEALAFWPLPADGQRPGAVLIAGGDTRGLMYALLEAARRIELSRVTPQDGPRTLLDLFPHRSETPERAMRSVCIFPHHEALDREWYRSVDFWRWYFDLLALHRFNHFSLTFGHQTAYLAPPYPFFIQVPEHPEVEVPSLTAEDRESNLALLRAISRLAVERGLDFTLGVWSQHAYRYGESKVHGLDGRNLASFAAAGMRRLLEACPDISGVQLRVNAESGIHLDEGADFWRAILAGIKACGRPIRLDLRAKGIVEDTIQAGLETGLPVTVSTKFWTEHQGLPYHATQLQEGDRFVRRHSYGDLLRYPGGRARDYAFQFRLWNLGTNKLFLWGDPEWVRRFAASSTLSGARGFEVCAPLSNKGFGEKGGVWPIFADPSYVHYQWEQQRYWYWYVLFGRLGYSGAADPSVWRREWAARLGERAAPLVEEALAQASHFLPLITACHSPSASVFTYWPEKDMGGLLDLYLQVEPSDTGMFASVQDAVADRVRGTPCARQTPSQLSATFAKMADAAERALDAAWEVARPADERAARELRGVALDVCAQACLARYHAAKLHAAEHLAAFYATGDLDSLLAARPAAQRALQEWEQLVDLTDAVYHHNLIFGRLDEQSGHWKDHLAYAQHDVARLGEVELLFRRYGLFDFGFDFGAALAPRTGTPPMPYLHDYRVERRFAGVSPQSLYTPEIGWGWGATYGLVATEAPRYAGGVLRAATANPPELPREMLYRDFVGRHPAAPYDNATFIVDLDDGDYDVTVILADRSAAPQDHGPMTVTLQGRHTLGPVMVPAGEIVDLRQRVTVTSGRLELELKAPPQSDWILTGLVITRVAPHLGHLPPRCVRPGQPYELRATVTSPEPLARVAARYRFDPAAPFEVLDLAPYPEGKEESWPPPSAAALTPSPSPAGRGERWPAGGVGDQAPAMAGDRSPSPAGGGGQDAGAAADQVGTVSRLAARLDVPANATMLEYYLEAVDTRGTATTWPAGGAATPRRVHAGQATKPPVVEHEPVRRATPGQPLTIRARVAAEAPLARVTLHYRNVNQFQAHDHVAMHATAAGEYAATIPAEHVTPEWDLMYHLEAVDALGNACFFPGLASDSPYVVVAVDR